MTNGAKLSPSEELERGFICRTFFARGNEPVYQTYGTAKGHGVAAEWFTDPFAKVVWQAAEVEFAKGDAKDVSLVSIVKRARTLTRLSEDPLIREVRVNIEDFDDLKAYVRHDDLGAYCETLRGEHMKAATKLLMAKTMEELASGSDAPQAISKLISGAQDVLASRNPCNRLSIAELCDQALKDWDEAYHQRSELGNYEWCPGLKLPWRKLAYTLNGFTPDVTVLAARPGVGKTSLALNFSRFWLDHGYKVVFVSVDMSPIGFVKRQISERSRISSRKLQFGKSNYYRQDREKVVAEINALKELEKTGRFTLLAEHNVDMIKSLCAILKDRGEIDVLIVDYLQLLGYTGSEKVSATQRATYVSNTLHALAVNLQVPVLCLSQLNRDNTKDGGRDPLLSDLRDSGAIEQDAANVLLLYRNEPLLKKWRETEPPVQYAKNREMSASLDSYCPIWMSVAKCREGDAGTKIPFVVVQNKYAWYLGDHKADGEEKFARVHDDWRHDPIEKVWMENGALIRMADIRAEERMNINLERQRAGLAPIEWKTDPNDDPYGRHETVQAEEPLEEL